MIRDGFSLRSHCKHGALIRDGFRLRSRQATVSIPMRVGSYQGRGSLVAAHFHCHAPACIGIWLYRNDPGHEMELLCHQAPIYGKGTGVN